MIALTLLIEQFIGWMLGGAIAGFLFAEFSRPRKRRSRGR